jgi:hypothetical protein
MNSPAAESSDGSPEPRGTTARQFHDDIEQTLGSRMARGAVREALENALKVRGLIVWGAMKRHPFLAMLAIGTCGVAAAVTVGVAELAFGSALAFAAYKILREGEPPMKALSEIEYEMRG